MPEHSPEMCAAQSSTNGIFSSPKEMMGFELVQTVTLSTWEQSYLNYSSVHKSLRTWGAGQIWQVSSSKEGKRFLKLFKQKLLYTNTSATNQLLAHCAISRSCKCTQCQKRLQPLPIGIAFIHVCTTELLLYF